MRTKSESQMTMMHATCVSFGNAGILMVGKSGVGKSALALRLMALNAQLVADDQTHLVVRDGIVRATCPDPLKGLIEARGVGLLAADNRASAVVRLVIDMDRQETERLPPQRTTSILGCEIALLHRPVHNHFPAAIVQYMKGGRKA